VQRQEPFPLETRKTILIYFDVASMGLIPLRIRHEVQNAYKRIFKALENAEVPTTKHIRIVASGL